MENLSLIEEEYGSAVDNYTVFSCSSSQLSHDHITNESFWTLRESIAPGGIAIAVILSLILCVTFGWNLFLIVTYIVKYKLLKEPANILLFSLALNDLLIGLMLIPSSIVSGATGQFQLGSTDITRCLVCSVDGFSFVFLTMLTLYILTFLSIDRFLLLRYPLRYKQYCQSWHSVLAVIIALMLCAITALFPLDIIGFGEYEFNQKIGLCIPRWTPRSNIYYVALPLIQSLLLIFVIGATNIWTYKIVSMVLKASFLRQSSFRAATSEETNRYKFRHNKQQRQIAKVFGILILIYIISWIPVCVMFVVVFITEGKGVPTWIYTVCLFLFLANPVIHPIIETFFIQKLRMEIGRFKRSVRTLSTRVTGKLAPFDALKGIEVPNEGDVANAEKGLQNNHQNKTTKVLNVAVSVQSLEVPATFAPMKGITRSNTIS